MKYQILLILSVVIISCDDINLGNFAGELSNNSSGPGTLSGEEWIEVPANAGGMGLSSFYVMKYEAKAVLESNSVVDATGSSIDRNTHRPVSVEENQPWRNISADDAAAECESLGPKYHLISNDEWMALAKDIEAQGINWTGNSVGSGCLFRGNSGETTSGDGSNIADSCGYNAPSDPEAGSGRDLRAKFTLSNGQEIFDLSGNVQEWTDWDKDTVGFQVGPNMTDGDACPTVGEVLSDRCPAIVSDYMPGNPATITPSDYDRDYGIGYFYSSSFAPGAARRGSSWGYSTSAGIFSLDLFYNQTSTAGFVGFRCVYRP